MDKGINMDNLYTRLRTLGQEWLLDETMPAEELAKRVKETRDNVPMGEHLVTFTPGQPEYTAFMRLLTTGTHANLLLRSLTVGESGVKVVAALPEGVFDAMVSEVAPDRFPS